MLIDILIALTRDNEFFKINLEKSEEVVKLNVLVIEIQATSQSLSFANESLNNKLNEVFRFKSKEKNKNS